MSMTAQKQKHPVHSAVLLFLLSVVVYGTVRELTAHVAHEAAPPIPMAADSAHGAASSQLALHAVNADTDLGPGEAEPILVQHPTP